MVRKVKWLMEGSQLANAHFRHLSLAKQNNLHRWSDILESSWEVGRSLSGQDEETGISFGGNSPCKWTMGMKWWGARCQCGLNEEWELEWHGWSCIAGWLWKEIILTESSEEQREWEEGLEVIVKVKAGWLEKERSGRKGTLIRGYFEVWYHIGEIALYMWLVKGWGERETKMTGTEEV